MEGPTSPKIDPSPEIAPDFHIRHSLNGAAGVLLPIGGARALYPRCCDVVPRSSGRNPRPIPNLT